MSESENLSPANYASLDCFKQITSWDLSVHHSQCLIRWNHETKKKKKKKKTGMAAFIISMVEFFFFFFLLVFSSQSQILTWCREENYGLGFILLSRWADIIKNICSLLFSYETIYYNAGQTNFPFSTNPLNRKKCLWIPLCTLLMISRNLDMEVWTS